MKESYNEGLASHVDRESWSANRKESTQALIAELYGSSIELRKFLNPKEPTQFNHAEGNTECIDKRDAFSLCGVIDLAHAQKLLAREPGYPRTDLMKHAVQARLGNSKRESRG